MKVVAMLLLSLMLPLQSIAEVVTLAATKALAPYIIEVSNSGCELDVITESLVSEGYQVAFAYQAFLRTTRSFGKKLVDGVLTVQAGYPDIDGAFLSDEYITYHNFAISLASRNLKIRSIADLENKRVIGFKHANLALGKEYELMAKKNPEYQELLNQRHQVAMLFGYRNDAIVSDRKIFLYFTHQLVKSPGSLEVFALDAPVIYHNIFEPSHYRIAFRKEKVRDAFNRGLRKLRDSGRYDEIIASYLNE